VIIWFQIIDYAKQEKRPIILVVDDVKEDWWQQVHGRKLGPRIELRQEMQKKADVLFYMYTADNFIQKAQDFLQLQVQKETIEEVRENRIQEAKLRESRIPTLPSPDLFPSLDLYPSLVLKPEIVQHLEAVQQIANAFGGLTEQIRQQQQFLKQMQLFIPPSIAHRENKENLPDSQTSEDDRLDQDQQDNSSDDTLDGPSKASF